MADCRKSHRHPRFACRFWGIATITFWAIRKLWRLAWSICAWLLCRRFWIVSVSLAVVLIISQSGRRWLFSRWFLPCCKLALFSLSLLFSLFSELLFNAHHNIIIFFCLFVKAIFVAPPLFSIGVVRLGFSFCLMFGLVLAHLAPSIAVFSSRLGV